MDLNKTTYILETKLIELEGRLQQVTKDMTQAHSSDSAEQALERENDEVIDAIGEQTEKSIQQIKIALAQIAKGSYGYCTRCGEAIDPKRLSAIPESTLCTHCC